MNIFTWLAAETRAVLMALVLAAVALPTVTNAVDVGRYNPDAGDPQWVPAYAKQFPGCSNTKRLADVLVVRLNGNVEVMDLEEAINRSQNNNSADDIWVVGYCD